MGIGAVSGSQDLRLYYKGKKGDLLSLKRLTRLPNPIFSRRQLHIQSLRFWYAVYCPSTESAYRDREGERIGLLFCFALDRPC